MPSIKHTLGSVDTEKSGFEIYEGPIPKAGMYSGIIKQMRVKVGQKSGNPYYSILVELTNDTEKPEKNIYAGCPIWTNIVPGEAEIQQIRVAQLLKAICGKADAVVVFDEIDDGGRVKKVGGKDPLGTSVRVKVKRETYEGEARAAIDGILPGIVVLDDEDDELAEVEDDEEFEDEELDSDEGDEDDDSEEEEEDEEDEDDFEPISYAEAQAKSLADLRKFGVEFGYEMADLREFKKKQDLLDLLVADGAVDSDSDSETPF